MNRYLVKFNFVFLLLFGLNFPANSQYKILEDHDAIEEVHQTIDSIYNLNFKAADIMIADLERKLGDYPGVLLLKAFYMSWKYRPIKKEHEAFEQYEKYLYKTIEESNKMIEKDENDVEGNFFLLASHGFLAELYVDNGQNFKAMGQAKDAYKYIKIGFDQINENPEFYFSSGIYNYYIEKYPEEYPFFKSLVWVFRSGDKPEGLKMLKKGFDKAVFTKAECLTYLFHINLRYEDKPLTSIYYARKLKDLYPNNLYYIQNFIENSVRLNDFSDLLPYIERLQNSDNDFYNYLGEIYYGIYLEKSVFDYNDAMSHYQIADELGNHKDIRGPHFDSILYCGMGRIYRREGKEDLAHSYFKKAIKSAEFISYRKDAQQLLKK